MKQVLAIVKPYLAERVVEALAKAPIEALTVREVRGYGRQKADLDQYDQEDTAFAFVPKVEVEVWVDDLRAQEVVQKMVDAARTGRLGDGKIVVLPVAGYQNLAD